MYLSAFSIIKWVSMGTLIFPFKPAMTGAPKVMLGTKWPSMTSMWIMSQPASMAFWEADRRLPKSAERMEAETLMGLKGNSLGLDGPTEAVVYQKGALHPRPRMEGFRPSGQRLMADINQDQTAPSARVTKSLSSWVKYAQLLKRKLRSAKTTLRSSWMLVWSFWIRSCNFLRWS